MTRKPDLPLTLQAYYVLKKRIMDLHLRPGEMLLVQPLAVELGISRTPVREALVRLLQEGFVEEAEGKKFRVSALTLENVLEIHELRELIEGHAVQKVARGRSEAQIRELRKLLRQMTQALKAKDHDAFFAGDLEFHNRIISFCGNQTLKDLMAHLNEKIQRIRYLTLYIHQRLEETIDEHDQVLEGIVRRDPEGAFRSLHLHLENVRKGVEQLFADSGINTLGRVVMSRLPRVDAGAGR